jgi:hypothetical protein
MPQLHDECAGVIGLGGPGCAVGPRPPEGLQEAHGLAELAPEALGGVHRDRIVHRVGLLG